jgi:predicted ATPase
LLTAILGPHESLESLTRVLIERTDGNPFFLEETVQTLVETKVLVGDRGAYRLTTERDPWPVRATAQAILAARIDRLSPEHKRLLQAASVIGRDVPFTLLGAIAPTCPRNACAAGSASSRRPSSSTRRPSSRTSSTRSSTPIQRVAFSVGSVSARRRRRLHFVHTQTVFTTAVVGVVALVVGWVSA